MTAIYRREMRSYFITPIGYVFIAVFLAVSGAFFSYTTLFSLSADCTEYFSYMLMSLVVLLPLLTMKSFSEEKKARTEQLLMTAPVSITGMVFAKFLAAFTIFFGALFLSSLSFLILYRYAAVKTAMLIGNFVAVALCGMAFIAVGVFISSVTENQLAAAVGTVGVLLLFLLAGALNNIIPFYPLRFLLDGISVFARFQNFAQGAFDIGALVYYLSITVVFLALTVGVFDRRRYN